MTRLLDLPSSARWWAVLAIVLALLAALGAQTVRLANERAAHGATMATLERERARQQAQVTADSQADAAGLARHAKLTQDNTHAYTTNMLALALSAQSGAAARAADAARIERLQHDIRAAATGAAYATADAAAARDLADQNDRLRALVERGVGIVGSLRSVAGRGRELVQERDERVRVLQGQIEVDRVVCEASAQ